MNWRRFVPFRLYRSVAGGWVFACRVAGEAGPKNSGATAILEQGLKWQPLGLTMVDSQFIESRNFQIRDIARAFNVPPYKLAIEGENEGPARGGIVRIP